MRNLFAIFIVFFSTQVLAEPPIEAYGELPEVRAFDYSPDGKRFAFFRRQGSKELMAVFEEGKGNIATVDVTAVKPQAINFISENHIIVYASHFTRLWGGFSSTKAFTYDIKKDKIAPLKDRAGNFNRFFAAIGNSLTPSQNPDEVFYSSSKWGSKDLLRANLSTGEITRIVRGDKFTVDWTITPEGEVLAREDHKWTGPYKIFTRRNDAWELIYENNYDGLEGKSVVAYAKDKSGLYLWANDEHKDFITIHKLSFDGTLTEPLFDTDKRAFQGVVTGPSGELLGIRYAGLRPSYLFLDPELDQLMKSFAAQFPDDDVSLVDFTDDFSRLVFLIDGGKTAPAYFMYDREIPEFSLLSPRYLRITNNDVMPVTPIQYAARDGLNIPAVLTHPKGASSSSNLPLIVLPHGGPESHNNVEFNDWAQYFANRGYLVLQPNFRGSSGFGLKHRNAGHGEYGGKMQTDIIDGAKYLTLNGWADPSRVCVLGASYGGYSALMNGALAPNLYKCIIAFAPVTDLPSYLLLQRKYYGHTGFTMKYWARYLGIDVNDTHALAAVSPTAMADKFNAPILLLHGKNDRVVEIEQSETMEKALIASGKNFKFIKLDDADHNLSESKNRLLVLQEMDRFVRETIGAGR